MIPTLKQATCSLILLLTPLLSQAGTELSNHKKQAINNYLHEISERHGIVGQTVAIMREGELVYTQTMGLANIELQVPVKEGAMFPVYSLAKLFANVALMQLVEQGKVNLDAPITRYVPNLPKSWQQVTVRHCQNHLSGLPNFYKAAFVFPPTPEQVLAALKETPYDYPMGSYNQYGQTNYLLIHQLIARLSGKSYLDHIKATMMAPLTLKNTRYAGEFDIVKGRVSSYTPTDDNSPHKGLRINGDFDWPEYFYASTGLSSNTFDLTQWFSALLNGQFVSKDTLKTLWQPMKRSNGEAGHYASGWEYSVANKGKVTMVGHEGGGRADLVHVYADDLIKDSLTVVYLNNGRQATAYSNASRISRNIAAMVAPKMLPGLNFNRQLRQQIRQIVSQPPSKKRQEGQTWQQKLEALPQQLAANPLMTDAALEAAVNQLGYETMSIKGAEMALGLFEFNVSHYAQSVNALDSLAEANFKLGRLDKAKKRYQQALQLDPQYGHARYMLKQVAQQLAER